MGKTIAMYWDSIINFDSTPEPFTGLFGMFQKEKFDHIKVDWLEKYCFVGNKALIYRGSIVAS